MFSTKWPDQAPIGGGAEAVVSAVTDVAERSFYAMAEACDSERFAELAAAHRDWLTAQVRFVEHECTGVVTCRLPMPLAERLFDAFSGRDPDDPAAPLADMHDLIGEFANMICGSWLTRTANERTFALSRPTVAGESMPAAVAGAGVAMAIDEQPCLVTIEFTTVPETAAAI
jgi:Chemotaxis phosphatase CheX